PKHKHLCAGATAALAAVVLSGVAGARGAVSVPTAIDLGTLGGTLSVSAAVNDRGQVVGASTTAGEGQGHAFSWTKQGGMVDLGTLGGTSAQAFAVNGRGQVVGSTTTSGDAESHAFAWTKQGGMVDLGTLGGTSSAASAVNESGQVVGLSF